MEKILQFHDIEYVEFWDAINSNNTAVDDD